jgi:excisionase family DNA binding protein
VTHTVTLEIPDDPTAPELLTELRRVAGLLSEVKVAMSRPEQPILLTQAKAAKRVGVSERTLYSWIQNGVIPTVTIDGRVWIRSAALDPVMQKREASK